MKTKHIWGVTVKEISTSYNIKKYGNNKETYTDGSKSTGRKVGFTAVFVNIARRGAQPEEASVYTTEITSIKTALREIQKTKDKRWIIMQTR